MAKEMVKHPDHYNKGLEVFKIIRSHRLGFFAGNAIKYICRAGLKSSDPEKIIEDLEKAVFYLLEEITESNKTSLLKRLILKSNFNRAVDPESFARSWELSLNRTNAVIFILSTGDSMSKRVRSNFLNYGIEFLKDEIKKEKRNANN